jgi:hypothetical protein
MQHLTIEDLARLVDEAASPAESAHLAHCSECAVELERLRDQTSALAALPGIEPPQALWFRIEDGLRAEGLAATGTGSRVARPALVRAAVNVGLFLLGAAAGSTIATRDAATPDRIGGPEAVAPRPGTTGSPVAAPRGAFTTALQEAEHRLDEAEAEYTAALAHYSELAGTVTEIDPVSRLVALEGIVQTTGAALQNAPADPVINGYFLSAIEQREAVLQQIARSTDDGWF